MTKMRAVTRRFRRIDEKYGFRQLRYRTSVRARALNAAQIAIPRPSDTSSIRTRDPLSPAAARARQSVALRPMAHSAALAAAFLHGRQRILALIAAALLVGQKILLLLPVWLMGVAA